jgi:transposase-like protein|tara:strand:- start:377 stop:568 length:192 start_codon:yes stop_codon:yes gene_type:complete
MDKTQFLDAFQLAERWGIHPQTLARWRRKQEGPKFIKAQHPIRILYPIVEVEEYEQQNPFLKK